jgi:protein TonB
LPEASLTRVEQAASDQGRDRTLAGADDGTLRRRITGILGTILAEILIIALLLTLGSNLAEGEADAPGVVTFEARNVPDEPSPEPEAAPPDASEEAASPVTETPEQQPEPIPRPETPLPAPLKPPPLVLPNAPPAPPPPAPPPPAPPPPGPTPRTTPAPPARVYGPPDTGRPGRANDSQQVGTAPNGEPMYAARWYRQPTRQELAGYLSTATAPASALIVCKTVPDFYVEDCQLLGESPPGSQIGRAVLAATWQFRVRPAIVNGRSQVGSWVRIRIDYTQSVQR